MTCQTFVTKRSESQTYCTLIIAFSDSTLKQSRKYLYCYHSGTQEGGTEHDWIRYPVEQRN